MYNPAQEILNTIGAKDNNKKIWVQWKHHDGPDIYPWYLLAEISQDPMCEHIYDAETGEVLYIADNDN